eukprot:COSAG04_NODE_1215_length_7713_cov_6.145127_3_plen_120_part_00
MYQRYVPGSSPCGLTPTAAANRYLRVYSCDILPLTYGYITHSAAAPRILCALPSRLPDSCAVGLVEGMKTPPLKRIPLSDLQQQLVGGAQDSSDFGTRSSPKVKYLVCIETDMAKASQK